MAPATGGSDIKRAWTLETLATFADR